MTMKTLQGVAASRGIAIGPAFCFERVALTVPWYSIKDPLAEWARFESALFVARKQLEAVNEQTLAAHGADQAAIFEAQAMMLDDPELMGTVRLAIRQEGVNAETALSNAAEAYAKLLAAVPDEYLAVRAADVRDVANRVLRILLGIDESPTARLKTPSIIVAADLAPSDTVMLDKSLVLGFVTAVGGATSHTAILARGLGLPAVVGVGEQVASVGAGSLLAVDGDTGAVVVDPDAETVVVYRRRQAGAEALQAIARSHTHEPAITLDGRHVEVVANIGNVEDADAALGSRSRRRRSASN